VSYKNPTPAELAAAKTAAAPTETEMKAREMVALYRQTTEWDEHRQLVMNVFAAHWQYSFTPADVAEHAKVAHHLRAAPDLGEALTKMTRDGLLRSRRADGGRRFYELNY
jgi:hypothetical protein